MQSRRRVLLGVAVAGLAAALLLLSPGSERPPGATGREQTDSATAAGPGDRAPAPGVAAAPAGATAGDDVADLAIPPGFDPDDPAVAWAGVDMDAVRRAMPDNRFWTAHMPTQDASVLKERERQREQERALRTRVESGNATQEEVDAHFTHLHKVFTDGIEFTTHLIEHYGEDLSERDLGLLMLARKLHRARLVELPREHARAHERRERMETARREWRAMQAAFGEGDAEDSEAGAP